MSKDIWGRLADTYEADHVYLSGADLVSAIKARVAQAVPDGEVVELGCGTGIYTAAYAPRCSRVIATDLSQRMVDRTRPALAAHPNVSVRVADAESTGLPGGSADGVVAVNLLHIVPNPEAIVAEAYRLLRPGGVLVVADATGEGLSLLRMVASIWRVLRRWGLKTHQKGQRNLTQAGLEELVRSAGFTAIDGERLTGRVMSGAFVGAVKPGSEAVA